MPLLPFSKTFECPSPVYYLPAAVNRSRAGAAGQGYPAPADWVRVSANVQPQPGVVRVVDGDGTERFYARFIVTLLDDPAPLNGGKGVRRDDAFRTEADQHDADDPRLMVAQGDAVRVGSGPWRVECLVSQA